MCSYIFQLHTIFASGLHLLGRVENHLDPNQPSGFIAPHWPESPLQPPAEMPQCNQRLQLLATHPFRIFLERSNFGTWVAILHAFCWNFTPPNLPHQAPVQKHEKTRRYLQKTRENLWNSGLPAVLSTHSSSLDLGWCAWHGGETFVETSCRGPSPAWYICAKVCLCRADPSTRNLDMEPMVEVPQLFACKNDDVWLSWLLELNHKSWQLLGFQWSDSRGLPNSSFSQSVSLALWFPSISQWFQMTLSTDGLQAVKLLCQ